MVEPQITSRKKDPSPSLMFDWVESAPEIKPEVAAPALGRACGARHGWDAAGNW